MQSNPARNKFQTTLPATSLAEEVLVHAQAGRELVQDFCPLADSLEWQLGQEYLRQRGNKAFISDTSPVPFVINNDGTLSRNAAEIFFASCQAAQDAGSLEPDIYVLELGVGVGLFARYFLDHFRQLCIQHRNDYYDRLCYIAADRSQRMLLDVLRHGVLRPHLGRYRVRLVDAMQPARLLSDLLFEGQSERPLRAVFLNYLLDCLPAAVLELSDEGVRQLCVRTCIARSINLPDYTDLTAAQLRERAKSSDPEARQDLLEVYGLFASEYDYRPVDAGALPFGDFALEFGRRTSRHVLHSYGAIGSLVALQELLREDGLILINDYGPTQTSQEDVFEHQRFSMATFVGVNFPQLRAFFEGRSDSAWFEPAGDGRGIHSRLLGRKLASETIASFFQYFGDAAHERLQEPIQKARLSTRAGRFELAANYYHEAVRQQPRNWVLLNEVSMFLTFQMRDPKAGGDMAKVALELNPNCSADLWSTLGDALFEQGRTAEARSAYLHALRVNETDVRARYNLAWTYQRERDYPAALTVIAEALTLDKTGSYRERLLQKQQEVLAQLALRHQQEYLLLSNLVSRSAPAEERKLAAEPVSAPRVDHGPVRDPRQN